MAKLIKSLSYRHSAHQVFSDFVELSAIALSNATDLSQKEPREARYLEIMKRYEPKEQVIFPQILGELVLAFEQEIGDHLGTLFHELELHNTYKGQFFTPYHLSYMMAKMTFDGSARQTIEERGFITANDPACGAGSTLIAFAKAMQDEGFNYQKQLHITAQDIDVRCCHMIYIQLSLMHVPAIVFQADTLRMIEFGKWYTPAHIMGGWTWKLKCLEREKSEAYREFALAADPVPLPLHMPEAVPKQQDKSEHVKPQQLTLF